MPTPTPTPTPIPTAPMLALEPAVVRDRSVRVELYSPSRSERLEVRQFTPYWVVVEVRGTRQPAIHKTPAKFELRDPSSRPAIAGGPATGGARAGAGVERLRCELEFHGWEAVSGNLDGDKVSAARLWLTCEPAVRHALIRFYRRMQLPGLEASIEAPRPLLANLMVDPTSELAAGLIDPGEARDDPYAELRSQVVYRADNGAKLGHLSIARAYSRAWIVHELGVTEGHPQSAAARLALHTHLATAPILLDPIALDPAPVGPGPVGLATVGPAPVGLGPVGLGEFREPPDLREYVFGYFRGSTPEQSTSPWKQRLLDSFVDWYDEPDRVALVPFDRLERVEDPVDGRVHAHGRGLEVDQVRPGELEAAVSLVRGLLPPLACAAFDIDSERLDRAYLHPRYAASGIPRGRRALVVRESGRLIGLALCEAGGEELEVGAGFDVTQLYFRSGVSRTAQRALLAFVQQHYRALGRTPPTLLSPAGSLGDPAGLGAIGLAVTARLDCMIWSDQALRGYRSFLRSTFAKLGRALPSPPNPMEATYLPRIRAARAQVRDDPRLAGLVSGSIRSIGPLELLGFMLHFCAFGVRMAESADVVREAGVQQLRAGDRGLAEALMDAAARELARGQAMLEDLFELGQAWEQWLGIRINVEVLLRQPPPRSVLRYMRRREAGIRNVGAAGLVAGDNELARLLAGLSSMLLDACARLFDGELRPDFAVTACSVDTSAQRQMLERILATNPALAAPLAEAGCAAASGYVDVIADCLELGRELAVRGSRVTSSAPTPGTPPTGRNGGSRYPGASGLACA